MKKLASLACALLLSAPLFAIDPITGPGTVCTGSTITLANATAGGTWGTSSSSVATITPAGVLSGIAMGVVTVTYTAGSSFVTTDVTVNPTPVLSSTLAPPAICDSTYFNYMPTSLTLGATFSWSRPFTAGIAALAGSGTGAVNELLKNNTNASITVHYTYTVTAGGCSSVQTVPVIVRPRALLSNNLPSPSVCSGMPFSFSPTSAVSGSVSFSWSRGL